MQYLNGYYILYFGLGLTALAIHHFAASLAHILISVIALAIFALAGLQAVVTTLQNYLLKRHPLNTYPLLSALPPVETMQTLLFKILWAGFIFLSLSFIGAVLFIPNVWQHINLAKLLFASIAWLLFASLLYGYYRSGWGNRVVTARTLIGVLLLAIAYFGSKWMTQI